MKETGVPGINHRPWTGDHHPATCRYRESNLDRGDGKWGFNPWLFRPQSDYKLTRRLEYCIRSKKFALFHFQTLSWSAMSKGTKSSLSRSRSIDQQINHDREQKQRELQLLVLGKLTHIRLVDPSIFINWTNLFPILGVSGVLFHFCSIFNRYSC